MFQRRFDRLKHRNYIPINTLSIGNFQDIIGFDNIPGGTYSITVTNYNTYCAISIHYTHTQKAFDLVAKRRPKKALFGDIFSQLSKSNFS
jgi:hypothetical protein